MDEKYGTIRVSFMNNKQNTQRQGKSPMIGRFSALQEPSEWTKNIVTNDSVGVTASNVTNVTKGTATNKPETANSEVDAGAPEVRVHETGSDIGFESVKPVTIGVQNEETVGFASLSNNGHEYMQTDDILQGIGTTPVGDSHAANLEASNAIQDGDFTRDMNATNNSVQPNNDIHTTLSTSVSGAGASSRIGRSLAGGGAVSHSFSTDDGTTMVGAGPVGGASKMTVQEMSRQAALTKPQKMKFPLTNRTESKMIKLARVAIWVVVLLGLPLGMALCARSRTSEALAIGTQNQLQNWGVWLFRIMAVLGVVNLIWGIVRWFKKRKYQQWGILRTLRELIGGGLWRIVLVLTTMMIMLLFVVPWLNTKIVQDAVGDAQDINVKFDLSNSDEENRNTMLLQEAQGRLEKLDVTGKTPLGVAVPCRDLCVADYEVDAQAARYFYFMAREFDQVELRLPNAENVQISVMGRKNDQWSVLQEFQGDVKWTITDGEYDAVALAVVNTSAENVADLQLQVAAKELSEVVENTNDNQTELFADMSSCVEFNLDKFLELPGQMLKMINQIKPDTDYGKLFESVVQGNEVKEPSLVRREATLCMHTVKQALTFEEVQEKMRKIVGGALELSNIKVDDESGKAMALVRYDPFVQRGGAWIVVQAGEEIKLVRLQFEETVSLANTEK